MDAPQVFPAEGARRKRVALLTGCAQRALNTDINEATIRLLTRHGCEVVIARGAGLLRRADPPHGQGPPRATRRRRANIRGLDGARCAAHGLDAVVINTSRLRHDGEGLRPHVPRRPAGRGRGGRSRGWRRTSPRSWPMLGLGAGRPTAPRLRVAYHAACSLQHGQQIKTHPKALLKAAGLRGGRADGQPPVLRLGRDLQPDAAGDLRASCARARSRRWRRRRRRSSPPATSAA